jgi:hypothetical protein
MQSMRRDFGPEGHQSPLLLVFASPGWAKTRYRFQDLLAPARSVLYIILRKKTPRERGRQGGERPHLNSIFKRVSPLRVDNPNYKVVDIIHIQNLFKSGNPATEYAQPRT